jgi:hypothetical protein
VNNYLPGAVDVSGYQPEISRVSFRADQLAVKVYHGLFSGKLPEYPPVNLVDSFCKNP